ncbi:Aste57867_13104 [Aphanomyces stellatus]|uniref:Acyltransferase n=1 Tax=Aphanomyces stellatus TaxID=120398 RepID=A0A485KZD3_9STRA|nr:hypothetical protein As57867_013056 [Aphanomyces stellatus]VFT89948.1 Aste57867_13104 [Aphanomyces stellatus]
MDLLTTLKKALVTVVFWSFYTVWIGSIVFAFLSIVALAFVPPMRVPIVLFYAIYTAALHLLPWGRWPFFCDFVRAFNTAFPYFDEQKLVFEDGKGPRPAKSKTLLSVHPHGVLACGWIVNGAGHAAWKDSRFHWLATDVLFVLPFITQIMYWGGGGPAGRASFDALAKQGENIALLPGGFEEASLFEYKKHRVFVKHRKGFVKLALQHGYTIYPAYTFGEEDTYATLSYFKAARLFLNKFKIPAVLFWGRWWCMYMPFSSAKLVTVVGKPIELPQIAQPTKEDVDKYHAAYVAALTGIFESHKAKYASDPSATLEVL